MQVSSEQKGGTGEVSCSSGFSWGGCTCTPLWRLVMYFCVHNCMSPSNDYAAVACSNNNQAQLHTHIHISSILISRRLTRPRVASRYSDTLNNSLASFNTHARSDNNYVCHECIHVAKFRRSNPKFFGCASRTSGWTPLSKFLNSPLSWGHVHGAVHMAAAMLVCKMAMVSTRWANSHPGYMNGLRRC